MKRIEFLVLLSALFGSLILSAQDIASKLRNLDLPLKGICAHRGAMETHPENTIAAFKEAIRLGAHMIEFDVQLTKDNELVVIHDDSISRTTNGTGYVKKLTLNELKKLDAGSWKSQHFKKEKIPTLKEVLQIMPDDIWLNVHLRGNKKLGIEAANLIVSENRINQSVIACDRKAAKGVRQVNTALNICNMQRLSSRSKYIKKTIKKGFPFIQIKKYRDNSNIKKDVERLRLNKVRVNYVQADATKEIGDLLDHGIDFIFTDQLARMVNAFDLYMASQPPRQ